MTKRIELLLLLNPLSLSRLAGTTDCTRSWGGILLARAPDLKTDESGACMKPDLRRWIFASINFPIFITNLTLHEKKVKSRKKWEFMGFYGKIYFRIRNILK
jgi:hypothetical protein